MIKPFSVEKVKIPTDFSYLSDSALIITSSRLDESKMIVNLAGCENSNASINALMAVNSPDPSRLIEHWKSQDKMLRRKLSEIHEVDSENVYLTSGAMGAIGYVFDIFVNKDTKVGLLRPDFSGFKFYADKARANITWSENLNFPYTHSNEKVIDFVKKNNIEFLITSNPSAVNGILRDKSDIEEIIKTNPETMHIIDEADSIYPELSSAKLTKKYHNVVYLGSFSKFYGLSGLRIGYLITPEVYSTHFDKMINPAELTSTSIFAAQASIMDYQYKYETQKRVEKSLLILEEACKDSPYRLVPGSRCFASYIDSKSGEEDPYEFLKRNRVKIAKGAIFGLSSGGRINLANLDKIKKVAGILKPF